MKKEIIKLLIADDHDLIRQGLKRILSFQDGFNIVGEAKNGEEVLQGISLYNPDVVLLDVNMPLMTGIEVTKIIKNKGLGVKIILLTVEGDRQTIHEAVESGIDGYILKDCDVEEIINAIETVYKGNKYIDKSLVSMIVSDMQRKKQKTKSILDSLSKRELEVLIRICKGLSNKEIGGELYLSEKTIKNYASNVFKKLNVNDRVGATIIAIENHVEDYFRCKYED